MSAAFTPHACSLTGQERCSGIDCGASAGSTYGGVCDPDGCDFNPYRMGNTSFYGPSMVVDTTRPFTVVTQFVTADGTATGTLSHINRFYVQDGNVIPNSVSDITGITATNAISDAFCTQQKTAFGGTNSFAAHGGMSAIGDSMDRGQVLVLSIWDDHASNMFWLDSTTPAGSTSPGAARGPCPASGTAADVEASSPNPYVIYSNIKIGPIGSTFNAGAASPANPLTPLSSASPTPLSSASPTPISFASSAPLSCTSSPAAAGSSTMSRW
jgi:cellulose 1,4-beta-cellobiosidase